MPTLELSCPKCIRVISEIPLDISKEKTFDLPLICPTCHFAQVVTINTEDIRKCFEEPQNTDQSQSQFVM